MSEPAVANTYNPQHWADGWSAVEAYREWEAWEAENPGRPPREAARALGRTEYQIGSWRDGTTPTVIDALQTAQAYGWLEGTTMNDIGHGLARLLAWVYASGSLTRGPRGQLTLRFTVKDDTEKARLERWADLTNVELTYDYANTDKVTQARVAEHPQLFARILIGMGADVGRATERSHIPTVIDEHRASLATHGFVATYLRNRGSMQRNWEDRFGFREERKEAYLDELAALFEAVLETEVFRMEKFVTLRADPVRAFLSAVDDVDADIDWTRPATERT